MTISKDIRVTEGGIELLHDQFLEDPGLEGWLTALLNRLQEQEDLWWELFSLSLDTAEGAQLDNIYGAIVLVDRNGRTDDEYRIAIKAQIAVNLSSGTREDLLKLARLLVESSSVLTLTEHFPGAVELRAATVSHETTGEAIAAKLREAKVAGVRLIFIYQATTDENVFTWDSTTSTQEWDGGEWATGTDGA